MSSMAIRWKVREYLERHNVTPYRLMKETGLAQGTVYKLASNEMESIHNRTLDAVIKALRGLTGKNVTVADLVDYEEDG